MKNKNILIIGAGILVLFGGFLLINSQSGSQPQEAATGFSNAEVAGNFAVGEEAPGVLFTDFEGNQHNLSDFEGKPAVLDFWSKWCPFCREEMPELQKVHETYGEELVIIGVHRTDTESLKAGREFANSLGITYLLAADPDDSLYQAAGGIGMPVAVFIDESGVVTEIKSGPKSAEEIESKVNQLIE